MEEQNFSRVARNRQKSNRILNILIGVVFVLIVITAVGIFTGGDDQAADSGREAGSEQTEGGSGSDGGNAPADDSSEDSDEDRGDRENASEEEDSNAENSAEEAQESDQPGKVIRTPSDEGIVEETIVDTSWKPIGTEQSGEHVSVYEKGHIDWQEKVRAMSYATGIPESDMIVWYVKNGGGPQKSIGTVSTGDKSEKYNVHLEWVDGEGWMPVRLDKLNSLEGAY